jgi:hypothetical protein
MLNFIQTPFLTYLNEENMTNLYGKTGSIYGVTALSRDILLNVRSDLTNQTALDFAGQISSYAQNFYIISFGMAILLIIVAVVIVSRGKKEKYESEERRLIISKGAKR